MKESANLIYKKQYNRIINRPKSLYEQMMFTLSDSIIHNDKLKNKYCEENGKVNFEKVEETINCMYTFLEMINTMKLHDINEFL